MLKAIQRFAFCALLVSGVFASAVGQTASRPSSPSPNTTSPTTATLKPTPSVSSPTATTATRKANTGEIYRWVDKNGKVQYGPDVPEEYQSTARKLDTRGNIVSSRVPASISPAPQIQVDDASPAVKTPVTEREKCEAAWQAYNDSQACFAKYRQGTVRGAGNRAGSNISQEGLANCQSLPEPAACR